MRRRNLEEDGHENLGDWRRASHGLDVDSIAVVRAKTVCPGK